MRRVAILGTASAVTKLNHDYTALAFDLDGRTILIDVGTNAFTAMQHAGLNPLLLSDIVLTHRHIDHIGGLLILLDQIRLAVRGQTPGLSRPMRLYGLAETVAMARTLLDLFAFENIEQTLDIEMIIIPPVPGAIVLETDGAILKAFPTQHDQPCIGLRLECTDGAIVAFSGDTAPHAGMAAAYADTDLLIHECTFTAAEGDHLRAGQHCTTTDVATIAHTNAPLRLALVHLGWTALSDLEKTRQEVAAGFHGAILMPHDGESITF